MKIIQTELNNVKYQILKDFSDPIGNNVLTQFLSSGSKMIRSSVAVLYIKANGIELNEKVYKVLAAGEIIHNASLLHDDVLDKQAIRRGKITVAKRYSSQISILSGDYLLSFAIEKLLSLNNLKLLQIFQDCTKKMTQAEITQYLLRGKIPDKKTYLQICEGKTASLFSAILKSCAIILKVPEITAENFASHFGVLYQLKNDLEFYSAQTDIKNEIYTIKNIIGIEKTYSLLDNYKEETKTILDNIADNKYKRELEGLIFLQ